MLFGEALSRGRLDPAETGLPCLSCVLNKPEMPFALVGLSLDAIDWSKVFFLFFSGVELRFMAVKDGWSGVSHICLMGQHLSSLIVRQAGLLGRRFEESLLDLREELTHWEAKEILGQWLCYWPLALRQALLLVQACLVDGLAIMTQMLFWFKLREVFILLWIAYLWRIVHQRLHWIVPIPLMIL